MSDDQVDQLEPNHHAHHPGFHDLRGWIGAMTMRRGRGRDRAATVALAVAQVGPGDRLVDIGCGPGVAARHAAAHGATVTGVDPGEVMLRTAAHDDAGGRVRWERGTAEALPLDDASCDVAWGLATVHHWHDLDASLAEVARVLVDGGRFLALERQVAPDARGLASHGWTRGQADRFAKLCRSAGFAEAMVDEHRAGRRRLLTVMAHRGTRTDGATT